jgi:hypothetical protein
MQLPRFCQLMHHTTVLNNQPPAHAHAPPCHPCIQQPEDIERDKLMKEALLWEYREKLGRRAAAEDRKTRAQQPQPAHHVGDKAAGLGDWLNPSCQQHLQPSITHSDLTPPTHPSMQLEQVKARRKAGRDYGMRVGQLNAERLAAAAAAVAAAAKSPGRGGKVSDQQQGVAAAVGDAPGAEAVSTRQQSEEREEEEEEEEEAEDVRSSSPDPAEQPHGGHYDATRWRQLAEAAAQTEELLDTAGEAAAAAKATAAAGPAVALEATLSPAAAPAPPQAAPLAVPNKRQGPLTSSSASWRLAGYARPGAQVVPTADRSAAAHPALTLMGGAGLPRPQPVTVATEFTFPQQKAAASAAAAAVGSGGRGGGLYWAPVPSPRGIVPPRVVESEPQLVKDETATAAPQPAPAAAAGSQQAGKGSRGGKRAAGGAAAAAGVHGQQPAAKLGGAAATVAAAALPDSAALAKIQQRVEREHIQLPPLCACGHATSALDPSYPSSCCLNCPVRGDGARWAALLAFSLEAAGLLAQAPAARRRRDRDRSDER